MQRDAAAELFGLSGTFPRPGWVVLDAARDHRFTGELVFDTTPPVRVYVDRGHFYLAERVTDPSLGARLVDAGALSAAQLDRGTVRIGEIEHLGRLFERVPAVDRHTVIVTAELMTEECVGWLANQMVRDATSTPYRHHESGMHQWSRAPGWVDLTPGDPLPAPDIADEPVSLDPPVETSPTRREPADRHASVLDETNVDELIQWNEPSWLDPIDRRRRPAAEPTSTSAPAAQPVPAHEPDPDDDVLPALPSRDVSGRDRRLRAAAGGPAEPSADPARADVRTDHEPTGDEPTADEPAGDDWIDRLESDGLPDADSDLLATPTSLPRLPVEPLERFEIVWPSGEIDDEFGSVSSVAGAGHDPDQDRAGMTARLTRSAAPAAPSQEPDVDDDGSATDQDTYADPGLDPDHAPGHDGRSADDHDDHDPDHDDVSDEVVLAVRRAVASIEVGSIAARQRLVDTTDLTDGSRGIVVPTLDPLHDPVHEPGHDPLNDAGAVPAPGRVAVRSGRNDWSRRTVTRSVFDEPAAAPEPEPVQVAVVDDDDDDRRAGALRRLISALRR